MIKFTIPVKCRTKKNHGQIIHTKSGRHIMLPSPQYKEFEKQVVEYITNHFGNMQPIDFPINLKCVFYKDADRKSDLVGYMQAIQDALVKAGFIEDDNHTIVKSTDGSEVLLDRKNPRIEVEVTTSMASNIKEHNEAINKFIERR